MKNDFRIGAWERVVLKINIRNDPKLATIKAEFLNLGKTDVLIWIILCCGYCPVHYGMFSSITDL
jgi:hypothetical protein